MLGSFSQLLAQDQEQASRFRRLGAKNVLAIGDLKAAGNPLPADAGGLLQLRGDVGYRPLWLAASTHDGEEEIAATVHARLAGEHPGLLTIIAPRHPHRGEAIARMLAGRGLRAARRSRGDPITLQTDVYLVDTLGELGLFYRLAEIVFIGGSMAAKGGHNPFEAARLDCAILHGSDMGNCAFMTAALAEAGAAQRVNSATELARAVSLLLSDARLRAARRAAGLRAAAEGEMILDRVLVRLAPWLDRVAHQHRLPLDSDVIGADQRQPRALRA